MPLVHAYSAESGQPIYGGRFAAAIQRWATDGDSLTSFEYLSDPGRVGQFMLRTPPMIAVNFGHPNDTTADILGRLSTTISTALAQGCGGVMIRMGTNGSGSAGSGAGGAGSGNLLTDYALYVDTCIASDLFVICYQIPPSASGGSTKVTYNAGIAAICAARPTMTLYVADGDAIADGSYNAISGAMLDGIHHAPKGMWLSGEAQPTFLVHIPTTDPRLFDGSDTYTQDPGSNQYVINPLSSGTGGTVENGTGTCPDNFGVSTNGSATISASIVASDDDDPAPWTRMTLETSGDERDSRITISLDHPAFAASFGALFRLDAVIEVRINLNTSNLKSMDFGVHVGGSFISPTRPIGLAGAGTLVKRGVWRSSYQRTSASSISADTMGLMIKVTSENSYASSPGYIDVRYPSVRGLTT